MLAGAHYHYGITMNLISRPYIAFSGNYIKKLIGYTRGAVTFKGAVIYQILRYPYRGCLVTVPK